MGKTRVRSAPPEGTAPSGAPIRICRKGHQFTAPVRDRPQRARHPHRIAGQRRGVGQRIRLAGEGRPVMAMGLPAAAGLDGFEEIPVRLFECRGSVTLLKNGVRMRS